MMTSTLMLMKYQSQSSALFDSLSITASIMFMPWARTDEKACLEVSRSHITTGLFGSSNQRFTTRAINDKNPNKT
jgi:hypothetical protein